MMSNIQLSKLRAHTKKIGSGVTPRGGASAYKESGIPLIRSQNVLRGSLNLTDVAYICVTTHERMSNSAIWPLDVLLNITGASIGRSCVAPRTLQVANVNQHVCIIRTKGSLDPYYLSAFLNSHEGQKQIWSFQGGGSREGLNYNQVGGFRIPLLPLPEQRKIAEILRTWDEAIKKLEALRGLKQKRLDGLRDALLFGSLRMNGQRRNWESKRLAEVTYEITTRNADQDIGRDQVMAVTKVQGIVPMREQTIGGDLSKYKHVPPHAFAYNPMRINVGSIAMNNRTNTVLVSPDYVVFDCTESTLVPDFLNHLRKTRWWAHYIVSGGSGSVRMRTYYEDLAAMKLPMPEHEEQLEITAVLNAAKADVQMTKEEIQAPHSPETRPYAEVADGRMAGASGGELMDHPFMEHDIPERDDLVVEEISSNCVEVFYVPLQDALERFGLDSDNTVPHRVRLLLINGPDQRLTIFPINTLSGHARFLKPKHDKIERITFADTDLVYPDFDYLAFDDAVPVTPDEVMGLLECLPSGFTKNPEYGLGLAKAYWPIIDAVEELSCCTEIVISNTHATEIDQENDIFFISMADFEKARKALNRVINNSQNAAKSVKEVTAYNILADRIGCPEKAVKVGRHPRAKTDYGSSTG